MHFEDIFAEKIFHSCPNCKQPFQGDVAYDLTKAQLSFVERELKEIPSWNRLALLMRMSILDEKRMRIESREKKFVTRCSL